jgi:hypothetical protein
MLLEKASIGDGSLYNHDLAIPAIPPEKNK